MGVADARGVPAVAAPARTDACGHYRRTARHRSRRHASAIRVRLPLCQRERLKLSTRLSAYAPAGAAASARNDAPSPAPPRCGTAEILSLLPDDDRHVLVAEYAWTSNGKQYHYDPDAPPAVARLDSYDGSEQVLTRLSLRGGKVLVDAASAHASPSGATSAMSSRSPGSRTRTAPGRPLRCAASPEGTAARAARHRSALGTLHRAGAARLAHGAVSRSTWPPMMSPPIRASAGGCRRASSRILAGEHVIGVRVDADQPEYHWLDADDSDGEAVCDARTRLPGIRRWRSTARRPTSARPLPSCTLTSMPATTIWWTRKRSTRNTCARRAPGLIPHTCITRSPSR